MTIPRWPQQHDPFTDPLASHAPRVLVGPGLAFFAPMGTEADDSRWELLGVTVCGACDDTGWWATYRLELGNGYSARLKVPCPFLRSPHHQRQTCRTGANSSTTSSPSTNGPSSEPPPTPPTRTCPPAQPTAP